MSHLFIIVLDPAKGTHNTIIVNTESLTSPRQDQTTVLQPGDHEFIKHPSYVNYRGARIESTDDLNKLIGNGTAKIKPKIKEVVYQKVCDGIMKSRFTPFEVQDMYQDHLFTQI